MAAIRSGIVPVVASVVLVACGADDDSSAETLESDGTEQIEAPTTEGDPPTTTTSTTMAAQATTTTTAAPESARYRVTVVLEWSAATHPASLPPGWHTSPPVLAAHETPDDVIPIGSIPSAGIESMAETGRTSLLQDELTANPAVVGVDTGRRVDGSGSDELDVVVTQSSALVSLVTMLAPSPDWFVGLVGVPLFEDGAWSERVEVDLTPWDAGTDSGDLFTSGNVDTQPRQVISAPRDPEYIAAAAEGRFGYAVIERIG